MRGIVRQRGRIDVPLAVLSIYMPRACACRAVPCRAVRPVPCRAVPCRATRAVPCRAVRPVPCRASARARYPLPPGMQFHYRRAPPPMQFHYRSCTLERMTYPRPRSKVQNQVGSRTLPTADYGWSIFRRNSRKANELHSRHADCTSVYEAVHRLRSLGARCVALFRSSTPNEPPHRKSARHTTGSRLRCGVDAAPREGVAGATLVR